MAEQEVQELSDHEKGRQVLQGIYNILVSGEAPLQEFQARINSIKFLEGRLNKLNQLELDAAEQVTQTEDSELEEA